MATHSIPFTDFQKNIQDHVKRLQTSGQPEVLSIDGNETIIIQDAKSYQNLLDQIEYAETAAGIKKGLDAHEKGGEQEAHQFFADFQKRFHIPEVE